MNISIVGTVGVPANYGGFETLVENLLEDNHLEHNLNIYCSSKSYPVKLRRYKGAKLTYLPLNANGIQSIPYDIWSLFHSIYNRTDCILLLGVSGALFLPIVRIISRARIVTNIDGLEWKRNKWNALTKLFLKISEQVAIRFSHVVVADNKAIADYVSERYKVECSVIAYGGDHALSGEITSIDDDYALALCRIEPENNIELILKSFSQTSKRLKFIGNWNNSEFGRLMKSKYKEKSNIEILDPVYDIDLLFDIRRRCSFYVHGHSAGGTNPSLVEMMHFNKPVFAFDCVYNRATTENRAQYFMTNEHLVQLINRSPIDSNAKNMKSIAGRRYTWKIVRKQYFDLFK